MPKLLIKRAPAGVSLQDAGRLGFSRRGISPAGPMDWARHSMANRMLEKSASSTAIEVGPAGIALSLSAGDLQMSVAAPRFEVYIGDKPQANLSRFMLKSGQTLELVPKRDAMWGYIGVQGLIDTPSLLGSQSENSASGMTALSLVEASVIQLKASDKILPHSQAYFDPYLAYEGAAIGLLAAAQTEDFSKQTQQRLVAEPFTISPRFDRMAYRLAGMKLHSEVGHDILSDGVTMGAIQVPGNGEPFILMADHQTTGGYPKIATICHADLPRIAQLAPGRHALFEWIDMDQAVNRWADTKGQLASLLALSTVR